MGSGFDYVRLFYRVPAKRGARVIIDGRPGRITSSAGHYIRVLFDGEKHARSCHPTWRVEYLRSEEAAPPTLQPTEAAPLKERGA